MRNISKFLFLILVSSFLLTPLVNAAVIIEIPDINNSVYWNGHLWSDVRWLDIDGGNANQDINVSPYNISAGYFIGDGSLLTGLGGLTDTNASTACASTEYLAGNGSCISLTDAISSNFDQTLNITDNVTFANLTVTNNITASWFFGYINWSWIQNIFVGSTTDNLTEGSTNLYDNQSWNETYADTLYAVLGSGNSSWNQTHANTLYSNATDNSSWNETYADTLYAVLGSGNASFNQTLTDTLYVELSGDDMTGTLTTTDWFNGSFNWTSGDDYTSFNGHTLTFNATKLEVTYYNATSLQVITGTGAGTLANIQTYNRISYNVTEDTSDYELRVNFTGITEFTTLLVRHKTDTEHGHTAAIQIWDYTDGDWEDYGILTESLTYEMKTLGVYDYADHISGGVVQVRFYQNEGVPPRTHIHQFDWVSLSKGFGTPVGQEIDPIWSAAREDYWNTSKPLNFTTNFNTTGNVTASYFFGNGSQLTGIASDVLITAANTSMKTYVDDNAGDNSSWNETYADTIYSNDTYVTLINTSMKVYVDDQDVIFNTSMKTYVDDNAGDNSSWNKTYADTLYAAIGSAGNPFDQSLNKTDNVTFANLSVSRNFSVGSDAFFVDEATWNIGINNSEPSQKFVIDSGDSTIEAFFGLRLGNENRFIKFGNPASDVSRISVDDNDILAFGQEDSFADTGSNNFLELMRIEREGGTNNTLVGINNTNPQYTLDVKGDGKFTGNLTVVENVSISGALFYNNGTHLIIT